MKILGKAGMEKTKIYSSRRFPKGRYTRELGNGSGKLRKKGPRGPRRWSLGGFRYGVLEIVLVACALVAMLAVADGLATAGEVYRGVKVAGVPVGGKTPEEARSIVGEQLAGNVPDTVTISGSGESVALSKEELGIGFDLESTVDRAYEVGRTGWVGHRISERLRANLRMVSVNADTEYNTELVRNVVGELASNVNRESQNAVISLSGTQAETQEGQAGYRLDQPATIQNVRQAIGNLSGEAKIAGGAVEPNISTDDAEQAADKINQALGEPLAFESREQRWELAPEQVTQMLAVADGDSGVDLGINAEQLRVLLPGMYETLRTEPKDAGFTFVEGSVRVEAAQPGEQIAEKRLVEDLNEGLFEGQHEFEVPLSEGRQPEFTTEEGERLKPTELLGKFRTNYAMVKDPDGARTYNLGIAADAINQTTLAPGEIFSVNDTVSQLDYKEAKVFQEGLIQYAEGGGLCQVASTLYVAALRSGMEIVERNAHYALLEYIKPGFDSTVWFGDYYGNGELDSQFKNTTDAYVLLREWVDEDGHMYAEVWGQPNGRTAELRSEEVDRTNSSSTWVTYKTVEENGEVVEEGVAYEDTYRSLGPNEHNDNPYGFDPVW